MNGSDHRHGARFEGDENGPTMSAELLAAAEKGDAEAEFELGNLYGVGRGVDKDAREAARWWQKAAQQGHPGALYNLGCARLDGDGVPPDPWLAHALFRDAARGYKRWVRDEVRLGGISLRTARRDAQLKRVLTFPYFIAWSLGLFFASKGIGRCGMFETATISHNLGLATSVLDTGMDINEVPRHGRTALIYACRLGATPIVELLISRGADVNLRGKKQYDAPPIYAAAESGELSVVASLLCKGADVGARAVDGATALMKAAEIGNVAIIHSLIEAGADVKAKDLRGGTALHAAAQQGNAETVTALLSAGADVNAAGLEDHETPLLLAAQCGEVPTLQLLVEAGADVNARSATGITPLHRAAFYGRTSAVQYLIQTGASLDLKGSAQGYTPLHLAAFAGSSAAVIALLDAGADVNECSNTGVTALQIAESKSDHEMIQLLQARGAEY